MCKLATMEKFRGRECCGCFLAVVTVILAWSCSVLRAAWAQDPAGFLNIDCGANGSYNDSTGLHWVPDAPYITTGRNYANISLAQSGNNSQFPEYSSLRYFDDSRSKNCYTLPVLRNSTYMLRTTFFYGNYDNALKPPSFELVIDATLVEDVVSSADTGVSFEHTYLAQGNITFLCLLRTSPTSTPFISGITLKTMPSFGFTQFDTHIRDQKFMAIRTRVNFGGTDLIRYPTDPYDRYWYPEGVRSNYLKTTTSPLKKLNSTHSINNPYQYSGSWYPAPIAVLQTAVATESGTLSTHYLPPDINQTVKIPFPILHFVELDPNANLTSREFDIQIPPWTSTYENTFNITPEQPSAYEYDYWTFDETDYSVGPTSTFDLIPTATSVWGPILNALEVFAISDTATLKTVERDLLAIEDIKASLNFTEWTGDPCLPSPHPWVVCSTSAQPEITAVNLSGYHLEGTFPATFSSLVALTSLSLDNNILSGSLPDLTFITNLATLRLQNNNLSGVLPDWLTSLTHLKELSVQNNNFSGPIPTGLLSSNTLQFTYHPGNSLLTGGGITSSQSNTSNKHSIIIGAVVGSILGVAFVLGIIFFFFFQAKRTPQTLERATLELGNNVGAKAYTFAEVIIATKNFNKEIGKGGFGPVFYGTLHDGQEVAVKVSNTATHHGGQGEKEFFNEVDVLSRVRHKNLVALVGYCHEDKKQILIYEYMHNGSLRDQLRGKSKKIGMLDWRMRLNIARDAAQGLEYLHTGCSPIFIHRDIKSSNILISSKLTAKVADFGLTKSVNEDDDPNEIMTFVKGTAGYLDPEYFNTHCLSTKSDIFSFGVVLLELLTGRPPIDPYSEESKDHQPTICDWARKNLEDGNLDPILAPEVKASHPIPSQNALWKVAEIALKSVEPNGIHRPPTMTSVLQELHLAVTMEEAATPQDTFDLFHCSTSSEMAPTPRRADSATEVDEIQLLEPGIRASE